MYKGQITKVEESFWALGRVWFFPTCNIAISRKNSFWKNLNCNNLDYLELLFSTEHLIQKSRNLSLIEFDLRQTETLLFHVKFEFWRQKCLISAQLNQNSKY